MKPQFTTRIRYIVIGAAFIFATLTAAAVPAQASVLSDLFGTSKVTVNEGDTGIDVSYWNGYTNNWTAAKNDGVTYAFLRTSYGYPGNGGADSTFEGNYKNATAAGVAVGVYHYSQATNTDQALAEAEYTLQILDGRDLDLPVVIDMEDSSAAGLGTATLSAITKTYCERVKEAGYTPMVYANLNWLNTKLDYNVIKNYGIWLAQYSDSPDYGNPFDFWQYSSSGSVSGIGGAAVDMNKAYISFGDDKAPTAKSVTNDGDKTTKAVFNVYANDVADEGSGVDNVKFAVWTEADGQDDVKWVDAKDAGDNKWSAQIDIADHGNQTGKYIVHAYAYDKAGNFQGVGSTSVTVEKPSEEVPTGINAKAGDKDTQIITIKDKDKKNYQVAVWSDNKGQDDIKWGEAVRQSDGSFVYTVNLSEHSNDTGKYSVHVYTTESGKKKMVGTTSFTVEAPTAEKIRTTEPTDGHFNVSITGVTGTKAIDKMLVAVWSDAKGQDDIQWYEAKADKDDAYSLDVDLAKHQYDVGGYSVHVYAQTTGGGKVFIGKRACTAVAPFTDGISVRSSGADSFKVTVNALKDPSGLGIKEVIIPVWTEADGKDDIKWYTATKQMDGTYTQSVKISDFGDATGNYIVHAYVKTNNDTLNILKATTYAMDNGSNGQGGEVPAPSTTVEPTPSPSATPSPSPSTSATVEAQAATPSATPTPSPSATPTPSPSTSATVEAQAATPSATPTPSPSVTPTPSPSATPSPSVAPTVEAQAADVVDEDLTLEGDHLVTKEAMATYITDVATYPSTYTDIDVTTSDFAQMIIDEATIEGVRPEVVLADIMLNTDNLAFSGEVKAEQFNFANLGVTQDKPTGKDFAKDYGNNETGIRIGVRAVVQHIKAAASTDSFVNISVDPDVESVERGATTTLAEYSKTQKTEKLQSVKKWVETIQSIVEAK